MSSRKGKADKLIVQFCPKEPEEVGADALTEGLSICGEKLKRLRAESGGVDANELYKVCNALSGLIRAGVDLQRWRMDYLKVREQSKAQVYEELKIAFGRDEKLTAQITAICDATLGDE